MKAAERLFLPDIQSQVDARKLAIDQVGIKGLRYPVTLLTGNGESLSTIASYSLSVGLVPETKGTHMSRFIEHLEAIDVPLDMSGFRALVESMLNRLDASYGSIEMRFPYFLRKQAPVSGVSSLLDYDVCWRGSLTPEGDYRFIIEVVVPVTSLCPCSREISAYGAHNQRSHITLRAELSAPMATEELVTIAENCASCAIYSLLKRPDEKYVTERAYENPKFVEDLVRDVALALNADRRLRAFKVESENFESIHNHSAFASIGQLA